MNRSDIQKLYLNELAITDPSEIDIEAIAYYLGARVKKRLLEGCEARIIGYDDRAIITVNESSTPQRNRFSIGHELGHWMRDRGSIGNLCNKSDLKPNRTSLTKIISGKEQIANEYASELLMPEYLFTKELKGSGVSFELIKSLKESFHTSLTATIIRYANFCDYPTILACYNKISRKRIWFHRSSEVPEYFYPVRALFDQQSSHYTLSFSHKNIVTQEVDADRWIDIVGAENFEVYEAIWEIGQNGLMVFIWWENDWHYGYSNNRRG